jgi:hypothetical protein
LQKIVGALSQSYLAFVTKTIRRHGRDVRSPKKFGKFAEFGFDLGELKYF